MSPLLPCNFVSLPIVSGTNFANDFCIGILFCWTSNFNKALATKFCMLHNSTAVVLSWYVQKFAVMLLLGIKFRAKNHKWNGPQVCFPCCLVADLYSYLSLTEWGGFGTHRHLGKPPLPRSKSTTADPTDPHLLLADIMDGKPEQVLQFDELGVFDPERKVGGWPGQGMIMIFHTTY